MSRLITAITLLPTNRHSPVAVDGSQLAALSRLFVLGSVSLETYLLSCQAKTKFTLEIEVLRLRIKFLLVQRQCNGSLFCCFPWPKRGNR